MSMLSSLLVLLSVFSAGTLGQNLTVCDSFHNSLPTKRYGAVSSLFVGKTGTLVTQLGLTEEDHKAGPLTLTIDNCGGTCDIRSKWENAVFEGNEDNGYTIALTPEGEEKIAAPRPPLKVGKRYFPVQSYVRIRLLIKSQITDGIPKIPSITGISFGENYDCKPRFPKVLRPICEKMSVCPSTLVSPLNATNQFKMTLTKEGRRKDIKVQVQLDNDVEQLHLLKISEKGAKVSKTVRHCPSLYTFSIERARFRQRKPIELTFHVAQNDTTADTPAVTYVNTKQKGKKFCGITCGTKVPCDAPKPVTTAPPQPATTGAPPPATTEAPQPGTTEAPTEAPAPATSLAPAPPGSGEPDSTVGPAPPGAVRDVFDEDDFDDIKLW